MMPQRTSQRLNHHRAILAKRPVESEVDVAADEQRASALADRLRGDPDNHAVALELADVLTRLQKDLELFALLSARLEDASDEVRPELAERQSAVLTRLIDQAKNEGREEEAKLYAQALALLERRP